MDDESFNGHEVKQMLDRLIEYKRRNDLTRGAVSVFIAEFNDLLERAKRESPEYRAISDVSLLTSASVDEVHSRLEEIEGKLSKMYPIIYETHYIRPQFKETMNVSQKVEQNVAVDVTQVQTIDQAIKFINSLKMDELERRTATKKLREFEEEIHKETPEPGKVKALIEWFYAVFKEKNQTILLFVFRALLLNWDKIFGS
jgi:hypothetical protein